MSSPLPVTVLNGFLGAGKTTLLNRMLREPAAERLGVLVNDFGALCIDAELIEVRTEDRIALSNGCICCSIQDDLAAALVRLAELNPGITRIVVECSGLSHPAGVLAVLESPLVARCARINAVVCLVDAAGFQELDYRSTELAIDQAAYSDLVVLNKVDLVGQSQVDAIRSVLLGAQPHMCILTASFADVSPALVFDPDPAWLGQPRSGISTSGEGFSADAYESVSVVWNEPIDLAGFRRFDASLPAGLLRAKGVLQFRSEEGGCHTRGTYQRVGKRAVLSADCPWTGGAGGRLVLIGRRPDFSAEGTLKVLAKHCPGYRLLPPVPSAARRPRPVLAGRPAGWHADTPAGPETT
jgi:G3E family GTPase